ncbi:MAG: dTDP-4-amino-4,6-dideoxygalactose transaminase [Phenylobacterium sp.]|uniref:dTDP-4-amino-4,6-dideoxygalactose transaminase n=1 Tax=Phenylobacterium sp. TaxID=1871053 RepID=UPI0025E023B8|nr:dTDP-4-amino-4,6-dideoxygalactose transaminase [Phenylobacterium sp.]MBA4010693.1 dTDP-4-amino-4,6-dideoxygalactose transaminase [Phenylobacterium sp.]
MDVLFNVPPVTGRELEYIGDVIARRHLSGDGHYTKLCQNWLSGQVGGGEVRLTHSCTAALEMAALLARLEPGDEVIMPSFTFVSTANAFVLRGAVPVFVDIRSDTLNLDETLIEQAITPRTKAIVVVHYAGVCCEMDPIQAIADRHGLMVIEDAAQALSSLYKGRPAGGLSAISCFSFHETKNVVSGEGGAIAVNDEALVERADIIREKGTNRVEFRRGGVDKYTWLDVGSSYLPSEINAAYLWAQLENADRLTETRLAIWDRYHHAFEAAEREGRLRRPIVPSHCRHNGHLYYLLMRDRSDRDALIGWLAKHQILAPFHYIPLHTAPAGLTYGRANGDMTMTDATSARLIRLPLFDELGAAQDRVIDRVLAYLGEDA